MSDIAQTRTEVMLILADPGSALRWWRLPADGVGLARMEFVVNNHIRIHPMALVNWDALDDSEAKARIDELTRGWDDKPAFFVDALARGIGRIAASRYPKPVILRMSDFKTNEYARLVGGKAFEPEEENPMLGLGVDRDSSRLAELFDDQSEAVKLLIAQVIDKAHAQGRKIGLCGQAPSDHPAFAAFLVDAGIDSISVNPDSFAAVKRAVAAAEGAH